MYIHSNDLTFSPPIPFHFPRTNSYTLLSEIYMFFTLKKSKKGIVLTRDPYLSSSFGKKNMWVRAASIRSGCRRDICTRSNRSWRLSRPLQNPWALLLFQDGPVFPCTDSISSVTLKYNKLGFNKKNSFRTKIFFFFLSGPKSQLIVYRYLDLCVGESRVQQP